MIAPLRRSHKLIWLALAILFPIAFGLIITNLPTDNFVPDSVDATSNGPHILVQIKGDEIELNLGQDLRYAFCTAHLLSNNGTQFELGKMDKAGIYKFTKDSGFLAKKIIIIDEVSGNEIYNLDL